MCEHMCPLVDYKNCTFRITDVFIEILLEDITVFMIFYDVE